MRKAKCYAGCGLHDRLDVKFYRYADDATLHVGGRLGDLGALGLQYVPVSWASISVAANRERQPYGASHQQSLYRQGIDIGFVEYPGSSILDQLYPVGERAFLAGSQVLGYVNFGADAIEEGHRLLRCRRPARIR
jgi:hypothetical protein